MGSLGMGPQGRGPQEQDPWAGRAQGSLHCADTSRKPKESEKDGHGYRFVSRGEMEADIKAGRYLEHGEYEGNLYGTKIDSIRAVVDAGKMCILDVNPQVRQRPPGGRLWGFGGAQPRPVPPRR